MLGSLKAKIRTLFALVILGLGLFGWFVIDRIGVLNDSSAIMATRLMPRRAAVLFAADNALNFSLAVTRDVLLTDPADVLAEEQSAKQADAAVRSSLAKYLATLVQGEGHSVFDTLISAWDGYVREMQLTFVASRAMHKDEALKLFKDGSQHFAAIRAHFQQLADAVTESAAQVRNENQQVQATVVRVILAVLAVVMLITLAGAFLLERNMTRAESNRARVAREREEAAAQQAQVVEGLATGLAKLAEGDLTVTLKEEFAPDYERLRTDFNAAVAGVQSTVKAIISHSAVISIGTNEIALAADDLAKRTEQQAASLEQTAAALDQITARVRKTATGSQEAQTVAATAQAETEASEKVVSEAVAAMGQIEGSAQQIGQIIGVIDEIAFQTNLLALNAGVEAARAGEAGRGFAVVASEVRALAQRAADAAKEIKTLVLTSMRQVERGVKLVGDTGEALARIQSDVSRINIAVGEIASSAQEQAVGLAQVNTAVTQMDQVTQQNAAMVEQSTTAVHSLSAETEQLNRATGRFTTDGDVAGRQAVSAHNPVPTASPRRPASRGNAALKLAAEPEDWSHF